MFGKRGPSLTEASADFGLQAASAHDSRRRIAVIISLVLILAAAGAALFVVRGVDEQLVDVANTYEVRRQARELIQSITDAETGQRGYILTQDERYLVPYEQAIGLIDTYYDALLGLLANAPAKQAVIKGLRGDIDRKREEMIESIRLARGGQIGDALALVRSDAGQALMEDLRLTIRNFISQEDAQLVERNLGVERYRQWLVGTILAALAGSATLAYALFTRTQAQVSALSHTRRLLQLQNEELEVLVRERTAETEDARAHAERERERVETLLQDTNHRIGNSLATVSSLLGLQLSRSKSDEVKHALEAAQNRVHAIASSHRRLRLGADLETADAAEFLEAVLADLQATQSGTEGVEFVAQCDPVVIKARDATTIGIIAGELVTNALKHAFPDGKGHIWVRFARTDGVITLTIEDDGKGLDEDGGPGDGGLGSMIVRQLALQFGGKPVYAARDGGGTAVTVPLPDLSPPKD
jgi:two-component sensor histidine kinase/CHASE3 domain sensor protein